MIDFDDMDEPEDDEAAERRKALMKKIQQLPPDLQPIFMEKFKRRLNAKPFYCARGRSCDGMPHAGANYNHARGDQYPPEGEPAKEWKTWANVGGRGSGKTRTGSEYSLKLSRDPKAIGNQMAIIAPTAADLRDTIVEGPSGLLTVCEMAGEPGKYEPSKSRFTFESGARALLISADEPKRLRGKQFGFVWADEPAHYEDPQEVWDQLMFCLRLGFMPHILLTTTPLPTPWMKARLADPRTRTTRASTFANRANLAEDTIRELRERYEGTRLGRQELHGEILDDVEGALWNGDMFVRAEKPESFDKIVVGVDPAGSANKRSDLTGIIVVGKVGKLSYVLEDLSGTYTPEQWAGRVKYAYDKWEADSVVVERNYGGDLVRSNLKTLDEFMRIREVRATRGKAVRAEPVVSRYEQGRVLHVIGADLAKLETEQVSWVPSDPKSASPNRVDALVWADTDLHGRGGPVAIASALGKSLR